MKLSKHLRQSLVKITIALLLFAQVTPIFSDTIEGLVSNTEETGEHDQTPAVSTTSQAQEDTISSSLETVISPSETIEDNPVEAPESAELPPALSESQEASNQPTSDSNTEITEESTTVSSDTTVSPSSESSDSQQTQESSTDSTVLSTETELTESSSTTQTQETSQSTQENTAEQSTNRTEETSDISSTQESSEEETVNPNSSVEESKPVIDKEELVPEKPTTAPVIRPNQSTTNTVTPTISEQIFPTLSQPFDLPLSTQSFVASDLNGFVLPLLSTYADQREAAIVVTALSYLNQPYKKGGKGPEHFDNLNYSRYVYQQIFSLDIPEEQTKFLQIGTKVTLDETRPGDLVVWEKENKVGIYLGQNKIIMADDSLLNDSFQRSNESEEIPGVRIFTLRDEQELGDEDEDQDLLTRYDFLRAPDYGLAKKEEWQLSTYGLQQVRDYPVSFAFQENDVTNAFIDSIGELAREMALKYDVFASVMIAQAILESGAGTSGLSRAPYYNLFGIKGSNSGASITLPTAEDNGQGQLYTINAAFRVYPSYQESLEDYVELIQTGISGNQTFYQKSWRSTAKNYLSATQNLMGKYATDTFYANKLNSLIATYQLTRFDEPKVSVSHAMMTLSEIPLEYRQDIRFPTYNGLNYNTSGSYEADQCTWYVFNRVAQLGGRVGDYMGNGADWHTNGQLLGYQTSSVPKVGYVISFKQGVAGYHPLYGHVAFVEAVGDEGVLISEGDASYVNYRIIPNEIALSSGVGYVAPK